MGVWPLILITVASFSAVYSVSYLSATPMTVICCHGSLPIRSALICLNLVLHEVKLFLFSKNRLYHGSVPIPLSVFLH